jgi:LacI family transcriptional regulator
VVAAVRDAAERLGYVSNAQAQALARSQSGLVGLVVHDIADPYFSTIASGAQRVAVDAGRQMLFATTFRSPDQELAAVLSFIGYRTDAIVLVGSQTRRASRTAGQQRLTKALGGYLAHGGRLAVVGQQFPGAHSIEPENRVGAAALARALVDSGNREFAVLAGPKDLITAADRTTGFVSQLGRRGLSPRSVVFGEFTRDGGYAAATELITVSGGLSGWGGCLFAVNDVMALGAMAALRDAGLRVPEDVGVAGFDDIPTLRDHMPALTTVELPLADLGARAVTLALADDSRRPGRVRVPGTVRLRASTAVPVGREGP